MSALNSLSSLALTALLASSTLTLTLNGSGLLTAAPALAQATDLKAEADRLLQQGREQFQVSQFRAAIDSWQQALQYYRAIGVREAFPQESRQGEAKSLHNLGSAYQNLSQYKKAIALYQKSLAIDRKIGNRQGETISLGNLGSIYHALSQYQQAIAFYQQSLAIQREIGDRAGEASSLGNLGRAYCILSQYHQSLKFYQQSLAIQREIGNRAGEARSLGGLGSACYSLSQYQKAIALFQQSLTIQREIGDRAGEATSLNGLGNAYHFLGQYQQATVFYQQSLAIQREIGSRAGEAKSLDSLGRVYHALGQYQQAIALYQQSLVIWHEIGDRAGEASSLDSLGSTYQALGQYQKAIEFFQRSLAIQREIGGRAGEARSLDSLGSVYQALGQSQQAIVFYQQSLAIDREISDRAREATSLNGLGVAYSALGQYQKAIEFYQQSLTLAREIGYRGGEAAFLGSLGFAYSALGEYQKAIEFYQQSLTLAREIGYRAGEGFVLDHLGVAYSALGEHQKAIELHQQSLAIAREIGHRVGESATLGHLSHTLLRSPDLPAAETVSRQSIKGLEAIRADLAPHQTHKVSLFEIHEEVYRTLQTTLILQEKPAQALEIAERGRGQVLVELLSLQLDRPPLLPPDLEQIQQIAAAQNATLVEYSMLFDRSLAIWVVQPTGEISFRPVDFEGSLIALADLADLTRQVAGSGRGDTALTQLVRGSRSALKDNHPDKADDPLQTLHTILIAPITDLLPDDPNARVLFVPHRELSLVPFAALKDRHGTYLIEQHTILTAASIQSLALTRQHKSRVKDKASGVLVVGNPTLPKQPSQSLALSEAEMEILKKLKPLPAAAKEAKFIAQLVKQRQQPITLLLGEKATETAVVEHLHSARIIHLATHGLARDSRSPFAVSGLIALAPSKRDDGWLTAAELIELTRDNPLNAELVVLSACETGLGSITGDGVLGLSRSLIVAGVPSVIFSLWNVHDDSTEFLMQKFYRQLQATGDKAQALRQAMLATMAEYPDPANWAAFTLIGEAE